MKNFYQLILCCMMYIAIMSDCSASNPQSELNSNKPTPEPRITELTSSPFSTETIDTTTQPENYSNFYSVFEANGDSTEKTEENNEKREMSLSPTMAYSASATSGLPERYRSFSIVCLPPNKRHTRYNSLSVLPSTEHAYIHFPEARRARYSSFSRPISPLVAEVDDGDSDSEAAVCPIQDTKIILTIDGGGSRGIIPLFYVNEFIHRLSDECGEIDKLPVDMYAGTSVGGMIATAAALGKTLELDEQYESIVNQIFSYKWWKWPFTKLFHGYTYEAEGRRKAVKEILGDNEAALDADLVIPFCSAKTYDNFRYRSYDRDYKKKFSLFDAIMSSSAAPTYFRPHIFKGLDNEVYEGTDGGLYANHPGDIALEEARIRYPDSNLIMIALGTGHCSAAGESTHKHNLIKWATKISDICLALQSKRTNDGLIKLSEHKIHGKYFKYIRINPIIDRVDCVTDGLSKNYLEHLETIARQSIRTGGSEKKAFEEAYAILKRQLRFKRSEEVKLLEEESENDD